MRARKNADSQRDKSSEPSAQLKSSHLLLLFLRSIFAWAASSGLGDLSSSPEADSGNEGLDDEDEDEPMVVMTQQPALTQLPFGGRQQ